MRKIKSLATQTVGVKMSEQLPLVQKCMDNSATYEAAGDTINANKWLELAMKAESYYSKQDNKIADDYYHIYDEFREK